MCKYNKVGKRNLKVKFTIYCGKIFIWPVYDDIASYLCSIPIRWSDSEIIGVN